MPTVHLEQVDAKDLTAREIEIIGSESAGRLLRFKDAVLAREEVNKNRDEISEANIDELAATLPLMALDLEHVPKSVVGFFTDARKRLEGGKAALSTDGIIFADRFPGVAQDVVSGRGRLSIEADSDEAECSVCHQVFARDDQYCDHLRNRLRGAAVRKHRRMTAAGGGVVRHPAGTNTDFDHNRIVFMASLAAEGHPGGTEPPGDANFALLTFLSETEYLLYGTATAPAILAKTLTTDERSAMPDSDFGLIQHKDGKKIRRFPMKDCSHAANALSRVGEAQDLSDSERAAVRRKAQEKLDSPMCKPQSGSKTAAADRAMTRLTASFEQSLLPFTPQLNTYRPVISPLSYTGPDPAWMDEIVSKVTERVSAEVATRLDTTAKDLAAVTLAQQQSSTAASAAPNSETMLAVKEIVAEKLEKMDQEDSHDEQGTDNRAVAASTSPTSVGLVGFAWDAPTSSAKPLKAAW